MKLNQFTCFSSLFILGIFYSFSFFIFCDAAVNYQISIQDPATNCLEWMTNFYDLIMADLVLVLFVIFFLIITLLTDPAHHKNSNAYFSHSQNLEIFWTIAPALVLLSIAYPSFNLLYSLDDLTDPILTVKIVGHQWYWSYEFIYLDQESREFDAYMVPTDDLFLGEFRLLTADNTLILPKSVPIKLLITSADVLHSWAVPSFGLKVDACPGRLNEASLFVKRSGLYFGQCSEICGVDHGFMPIMVKIMSMDNWVERLGTEYLKEETANESNSASVDKKVDKLSSPEVKRLIQKSLDESMARFADSANARAQAQQSSATLFREESTLSSLSGESSIVTPQQSRSSTSESIIIDIDTRTVIDSKESVGSVAIPLNSPVSPSESSVAIPQQSRPSTSESIIIDVDTRAVIDSKESVGSVAIPLNSSVLPSESTIIATPLVIDPEEEVRNQKGYSKFLKRFLAPELENQRAHYRALGEEVPKLPELLAKSKGIGVYHTKTKDNSDLLEEVGDIQSPSRPVLDEKADFIAEPKVALSRGKIAPSFGFALMRSNSVCGSGVSTESPAITEPNPAQQSLESQKTLEQDLKNPYIRKFYSQLGPHTRQNLADIRPKPKY